jgi:hypothetical protein
MNLVFDVAVEAAADKPKLSSFRVPEGIGINSARKLSGFQSQKNERFLGKKRASD